MQTDRRSPYRVGVIGLGGIGVQLARFLRSAAGYELAFVHNRSPRPEVEQQLGLPSTEDLGRCLEREVDLVVEAAHPAVTHQYGVPILERADYLPVSSSALADDRLRERLERVALDCGTRLLIPHGALVGLDALIDSRDMWEYVGITFTKHPGSLDGAAPEVAGAQQPVLLYDGSVRGIAARYPRNVNSMISLALATTGLDECHARLVADPGATRGRLDIEARGRDGSELRISRAQPMQGVSGSEMFASVLRSVKTAAADQAPGTSFV